MTGAEVVIVGGGPAGSVLATLLARRGRGVVILDRSSFPRPKPCGESLNPGGVRALFDHGLGEAVEALGPSTMRGWVLRSASGTSATADFDGPKTRAWGVPRSRLDATLLDAARSAGARVVEETTLLGCETGGRGGRPPRLVARDRSGRKLELQPRVLVGADGLGSRVATSLGWRRPPRGPRKASLSFRVYGTRTDPERGTLFLGNSTTLGIAPVSADGREWNVTLVASPDPSGRIEDGARMAADPHGLLHERMAAAGIEWLEGPRIVGGPWTSGSFHRRNRTVTGPGVLLVGDAAGYYDPLTGQGISRAIRGAEIAAQAVDLGFREGRTNSEFPGYASALERMIRPTRTLQKAIEFVVSRPRVRDAAVGALRRSPSFAGLLVGITGDHIRPGDRY